MFLLPYYFLMHRCFYITENKKWFGKRSSKNLDLLYGLMLIWISQDLNIRVLQNVGEIWYKNASTSSKMTSGSVWIEGILVSKCKCTILHKWYSPNRGLPRILFKCCIFSAVGRRKHTAFRCVIESLAGESIVSTKKTSFCSSSDWLKTTLMIPTYRMGCHQT